MYPSTMQLDQFHCHVYFTDQEQEAARQLLARIESKFGFAPGKFHLGPVGPHIGGSCQVKFGLAEFGGFVTWLMGNRDGLTCFIHGLTGDDYVDHTDYVLWLGKEWDLNLRIFESSTA